MPVLKANTYFYSYEVSDILAENLKRCYNYGFLELGAYSNIYLNNKYSTLQRVNDDRYVAGQVYEGFGPGWVWENDVNPIGTTVLPFQVSGIYVNNIFYGTTSTSGQYSHIVDYERGRVIFTSGLTPYQTDIVQCQYTMRDVAVYLSDTTQWKTIINSYSAQYSTLGQLAPSGMAAILKENRVWLPSVVIDIQDRTNKGLQLGGGDLNEFAVFYHIFSDRPGTNKKLSDLMHNQTAVTLNLFDINSAPFPLNFDGSIASGAITYPNLASKSSPYFWSFAHTYNTKGGPKGNYTDIYRSELIAQIEVERSLSTF